MELGLLFVVIACIIGFIMTWSVGANDLANIMSTAMGSKAISVKQAIIFAVIFEFAGAILGGSHVTDTIRQGIINTDLLTQTPDIYVHGMLAVLLGASTWMLIASFLGMPVSITNAIVGSVVGFGVLIIGSYAIHWEKVGFIALSWIFSPAIAGFVSFGLFKAIQKSILATSEPYQSARHFMPVYLFFVGIVLSVMLVLKGLHHFDIYFNKEESTAIVLGGGIIVILLGMLIINKLPRPNGEKTHEQFIFVEKMFSVLMAFTACAMIFAHGSNDVALSVGPLVAIINVYTHGGQIVQDPPLPLWTVVFGCVGVVTGLAMYGRKVIETVGSGITALTPSRAFCATLAAAMTVIVSTSAGTPVSATQTLVGAVLGVGLARGIGALNITVIRNIFMSWVVTIPVAATLTIVFYYILATFF